MSKLDARKETISFLTKIFFVLVGVIVLTVGSLATMMYMSQNITIVFWVGIGIILLFSIGCLATFKSIQKT